ncbi:NADP-dependent malic enzyme [Rhodomicrobium vannielii ATCC 17100]|uniref:NADP-dependent malic enzyme n=1 Tax=Rhodomicrobium vannielii TaxID=1069 RepID=UPI0019191257|nr:NADP-dependent malic enzyme [Rhodomicrobium vannielii]MBJ7533740.1 NADP-dependent malic enzyme [Rhodomicrobium vannielii ATCC 17100]
MAKDFKQSAIEYHESDPPGKLAVTPTKPLSTQRDLSLAYSPGVAFACDEIVADPAAAARLTARANLIGVITNGTAVLGLGNIGPLASKPVMEGKAVLFKKFAGIDVFDIEVDAKDPDRFVDAVAALEPTFGAINLEDIKAPECFEIEQKLRERMKIPVMHDDQHGTAIVVAAAILNGLKLVGKDIGSVRLACCGGGAAALACLNLLVSLGLKRENIFVSDRVGVVYEGRTEEMNPYLARYAQPTEFRKLAETLVAADIFLGLSAPRVVSADMVKTMAERPIIMALANPTPEIMPDEVKAVRPDAIIATGRSDFPNQVNNVLCFPFLFRGALDAGATEINETMKKACAMAIADLAQAEAHDIVLTAYGAESFHFGPDYIIPKPFDPRLITRLAPAVARAAMESGVATRPIADFAAYREKLVRFVFRSGLVMKPVFEAAKRAPKRVIFAEGDRVKVLQAAYQVLSEGIAQPILVGSRKFMEERLRDLALPMKPGVDFQVFDPTEDASVDDLAADYHRLTDRKGITRSDARVAARRQNTVIAAMLLKRGEADAMICGTTGRFDRHLKDIGDIIGLRAGVKNFAALNALVLESGTFFVADTQVNYDPTAEEVAEAAVLSARQVARFGLTPKLAFLSHSNFGSGNTPSAKKMREALQLFWEREPGVEAEGEMHSDMALSEGVRRELFPYSKLEGEANVLIMPSLDAANIAYNAIKVLGSAISIGPILLGAAMPAHIVTPSASVRGLVNMTAVAVVGAGESREAK